LIETGEVCSEATDEPASWYHYCTASALSGLWGNDCSCQASNWAGNDNNLGPK